MRQELRSPGYEDAFVDVLGARVHYLQAGTGRPMLLIHGLAGSCFNWRRNIDALAQEFSVYAIDLVNMGQSDRVPGLDAGLEATADRIALIMTALGLEEADIAGHSHGGAVALMLAARYPKRVRSLILFAPANPYSNASDFLVRFYSTFPGRLAARIGPYLPRRVQLIALERMYGDPERIVDGSLEGYVNGLRVPGTVGHVLSAVRVWFSDMAKLKSSLPRLAATPTLLVWGDCDRAVDPDSASRLRRVLRRSELCIVEGGGHVVFEEMPEQSNRIMLEWMRSDLAARGDTDQSSPAAWGRELPRTASTVGRPRTAAAMERLPSAS
jgi:pimeloyl-ACP methyl ester carboxylesterase